MNGELSPNKADVFRLRLAKRIRWYSKGRKAWSFAYHFTIFSSAVLSAAAAVVPQLHSLKDWPYKNDLTSTLAGLAALFISLATLGGFNRKWRANRTSNGKVLQLEGELLTREPNASDVERLNQIDLEHDRAVPGE